MKPPFSFSRDFKKQYHSRDKKTRDEVDAILKGLVDLYEYTRKKDVRFQKIKLSMPLRTSGELLGVVMIALPTPKIIIRRIE